MTNDIEQLATARNITRLCHFTPSRNLQHIAAGRTGVLSTKSLSEAERAAFNATDLERLDRHTGHVCCSIEYPNAWYFRKARDKDPLFPDWVVLLFRPDYLWHPGTLFSPRNAAAGFGAGLKAGGDGFEAMFAPAVSGAYGRSYTRTPKQRPCCPTDQQAEVLVEDKLLLSDVIAVAVQSSDQAATERARLRVNGMDPNQFTFVIAPHMFNANSLDGVIRFGLTPSETVYSPPGANDADDV